MNKTEKIIQQFITKKSSIDDFKNKLQELITILLRNEGVNCHQITSRTKDEPSIRKKIEIKSEKYDNLFDITDIIGARIITYFDDEVEKIAEIISKEFNVDPVNSVDKRILDSDRFGYQSLHFIIDIKEPRRSLTEWKKFTDFKAEIQIRSILQHAWAEIEHDLGYKGKTSVPQQERRTFFRIAALLETADKEFIRLRNNLANYEEEVPKLIEKSPEDVLIDKASLLSYKNTSTTLMDIEHSIASNIKAELRDDDQTTIALIDKINYMGIKSIKELDEKLKQNRNLIVALASNWLEKGKYPLINKGIGIFYLLYCLITESEDSVLVEKYFSDNSIGMNPSTETQRLFDTMRVIKTGS